MNIPHFIIFDKSARVRLPININSKEFSSEQLEKFAGKIATKKFFCY
jgi:hypothetical protein